MSKYTKLLVHSERILNDKGYVKLYDISQGNANEQSRIDVVTTVASASFGKDKSKNPTALYNKLFSEKNTTLEFIRTFPKYDIETSLRNRPNVDYCKDHYDLHNQNVACVKIKAPLMVIAHLVRHRSFSFNQCSRRYTKVTKDDLLIDHEFESDDIIEHINESIRIYQRLINEGINREKARMILPAYMILSELWMVGNVKAWKILFETRLSKNERTQDYTREVVQAIYDIICKFQPEFKFRLEGN